MIEYATHKYTYMFTESMTLRVTGRIHTNYNQAGSRAMYVYHQMNKLNTNTLPHYNYQSYHAAGYVCHSFDIMVSLSEKDYLRFYDGGYLTVNSAQYDEVSICPILFKNRIGGWSANSQNNGNVCWCAHAETNEKLYKNIENQTKIEIKQAGFYRICALITSYLNGANQVTLNINNGNQYCLSAMGTHGANYYNTHYISEILQLKASDKIYFNCPKFHGDFRYNHLFIEQLCVEGA